MIKLKKKTSEIKGKLLLKVFEDEKITAGKIDAKMITASKIVWR